MKKSLKILLLLVLSLLLAASTILLVACNENVDPNEFAKDQGNTVRVILDSMSDPLIKNLENLDEKMSYGIIDYRLKPFSPIPEPGVTKDTNAPVLEGYIFQGYYEGTVENGNLIYGKKWDFSRKVNVDMTLYGKWVVQYKIRINYVINGQLAGQYEDVNVAGNAESVTSIKEPSWTGNTFVQMYDNASCEKGHELVVSSAKPFTHGCTQDAPIRNVYAQFMEGSWTLVRTASDMKTISAGARLYLMNDIDIATLGLDKDGYAKWSVPDDFTGVIEGNGFTISNFNFRRTGTNNAKNPATNNYLGLFSRLDGATIRNVTFKNCTVTGVVQYQQKTDYYYYGFIAGEVMRESTLDNITFDNCQLKELQFTFRGFDNLSEEDKAKERAKILEGVGDGSTYIPKIV